MNYTLLTTAEVSKILRVDTFELWRLNKSGKLPYIVINGGLVRYNSIQVDDYLKQQH